MITVDRDAENCIVVASGANADFSVEDVRNSRALLQSCDILLMQLEIPIPAVVEAARIASEAGATVVLNPAPYCELPEEVFRHVSLFIPNRTELSSFSGVKVSDVESAVRAAGVLFGKGVGKMIVTMGSRGSLIVEKDGHEFIPALKVEPSVLPWRKGSPFRRRHVSQLHHRQYPSQRWVPRQRFLQGPRLMRS